MQYKPRLFSGSRRRSREMDLPADFELLGEQLADDAAFLAKVFPPSPVRSQPPRRARVWRPAIAAAAVVLIAAGAWSVGQMGDGGRQVSKPAPVVTDAVVSMPVIGVSTPPSGVASLALHTEVTDNPTEADIEAVPAIWFYELNAPEQEALLDWWEQEGSGSCELSF